MESETLNKRYYILRIFLFSLLIFMGFVFIVFTVTFTINNALANERYNEPEVWKPMYIPERKLVNLNAIDLRKMKFKRDEKSHLMSHPKFLDHQIIPPSRKGSCCVTDVVTYDVYCFGGYGKVIANGKNSESVRSPLNDLWLWRNQNWVYIQGNYEIDTSWNETIDFSKQPQPRAHCGCWLSDDRTLYILGGENAYGDSLKDFWSLRIDDQMINNAIYLDNLKPIFIDRWKKLNDFPKSISHISSWKTPIERFWFFGGKTSSNQLTNELWRYDKKNDNWNKHFGNEKSSLCYSYNITRTYPNCKINPFIWTDTNFNFYLYGGSEFSEIGRLSDTNDLWHWKEGKWIILRNKTECKTENWIDVYYEKESANPDCRSGGVTWHSLDGRLWLWGGASNSMIKADLWSFSPEKKVWEWQGGSPLFNSPSFTHYSKAYKNLPPSLKHASSWIDRNGLVYITFGEDCTQNYYSELWTYQTK